VIDIEAILAAIPAAVARYRELVENLGSKSPIDIEQAREIIRSIADRILVHPGDDGVPVAEISLNEQLPLARVAGGDFDIGVVAGGPATSIISVWILSDSPQESRPGLQATRGLGCSSRASPK
jgi:hypothetical protein